MTGRASHFHRARRDRALRAQFQQQVLSRLRKAEQLTGDSLGGICNLIIDLGAAEVAQMLVDPHEVRDPPTGFIRLLEHKLARLTIEQAIVDFAHAGLFAGTEIDAARARLSLFRHAKPHSSM